MKSYQLVSVLSAVLVLLIVGLACATALPAATDTPLPKATNTSRPTATTEPSPTPDVAATQRADEFASLLDKFVEKGYVESTEGEVVELEPFEERWAQIGWYQWWPFEKTDLDFLFKAHFKWSTASATPDTSGCGIVFGLQDNGDHYSVFLDKSRILFLMKRGKYAYEVGKASGSGRTNFGNPAEADFAISVKGQNAYVSVDDEFTGYALSADQTTKGNFAYSLISGTNKDYGTVCEMTEVMFWTPK